ncbi:hypothetical protein [Thermomonas sp.]|uniref:hypothetical protein n=1 Tax=Thermomonas sp. TaxID=1971895 RepID=UPI002489132D|nr:hypothetical protein [Thermomonas sp.]MDI1253657.1 hypothetical protein [Thermomonas sp.]
MDTLPLHSRDWIYPENPPTNSQVKHMSNPTNHESANSQTNADKVKRDAEFLKQVKSEDVPSGIRPDLAPPGADGEGGDGGGVGSSI